ncbi:MAG: response regulator transcription factor [Dehalococcoidia bacterium]
MKPRILIVDDETQLRRALTRSLEGHDYAVREAEDGAGALSAFDAFKPDLVLLDLMLPDMGGVDVCRELRRKHQTPIIVLSVIGEEMTKVAALDEGADDYLTKPFGMDELLARVRVALRRGAADRAQQARISSGGLTIDFERRLVTLDGREVHLTPTEYSLLKYLAFNAGKVLTHTMILREVWGADYVSDTHVLRTCVNQLRSKLNDDAGSPRYIRTDPGVGYRFAAHDAER